MCKYEKKFISFVIGIWFYVFIIFCWIRHSLACQKEHYFLTTVIIAQSKISSVFVKFQKFCSILMNCFSELILRTTLFVTFLRKNRAKYCLKDNRLTPINTVIFHDSKTSITICLIWFHFYDFKINLSFSFPRQTQTVMAHKLWFSL